MPTARNNKFCIRWLILFLATLSFQVDAWASKTVVLAASDSPPLHSPKMKHNGALSHIVETIFTKAGYTIELQFMPWARAMASARSGAVDGMIGVWHSPERAQFLYFSDPIIAQQMAFYRRADNPIRYSNYSDLADQGYVLANVRGYVYPPPLRGLNFNVQWVNQPQQYLKMLLGRRVDLVLFHEEYLLYLMSKPEYQDSAELVVRLGNVVDVVDMHLVLSRQRTGSQALLEEFNQSLLQLKRSGEITNLLALHGLDTVVQVDE